MLFDIVVVFVLTSVVSFVGSLQPGPVNMAVINTTLTVSFRSAMLMAIGGVIPEILYSSIALWLSMMLLSNQQFITILQIVSILFLAFAGVYFLLKKNKPIDSTGTVQQTRLFAFGFMSGLLNPMLLVFWMAFLNFITIYGFINIVDTATQIAFVTGTASGAFLLLYVSAMIAQKQKTALFSRIGGKVNMITGVVFLILALWGIFKLLV